MAANKKFDDETLARIHKDEIVGIRAGSGEHRIIGIWAVVVERRVFVRSWSIKPRSWYRTFLVEPVGILEVAGRPLAVRAVHTRSDRLKDRIDRAYLEKYSTPGSLRYAQDLGSEKCRATTTELVPA